VVSIVTEEIPQYPTWRPTKQEMLDLQREHGGDFKIGKAVGRSKSFVQTRRWQLGVPPWNPKKAAEKPQTEEDRTAAFYKKWGRYDDPGRVTKAFYKDK
jgi:hypothetical protein